MKQLYDTIIEKEKDGTLYTTFAKYMHEIKTNKRLREAIDKLTYSDFMKKCEE